MDLAFRRRVCAKKQDLTMNLANIGADDLFFRPHHTAHTNAPDSVCGLGHVKLFRLRVVDRRQRGVTISSEGALESGPTALHPWRCTLSVQGKYLREVPQHRARSAQRPEFPTRNHTGQGTEKNVWTRTPRGGWRNSGKLVGTCLSPVSSWVGAFPLPAEETWDASRLSWERCDTSLCLARQPATAYQSWSWCP